MIEKDEIRYEVTPDGLATVEIANHGKKNSLNNAREKQLAWCFRTANEDPNVKAVLWHGGEFFSAGYDLTSLHDQIKTRAGALEYAKDQVHNSFLNWLLSIMELTKPLVVFIRGAAIGMSFTTLAFADFIYMSPEAFLFTPFVMSRQSPEGLSSYMFAKLMGPRKATEILLSDQRLKAKDALDAGFINGIIDMKGSGVDAKQIPLLQKLLTQDAETTIKIKKLMMEARDHKTMVECLWHEGDAIYNAYTDPEYTEMLASYMEIAMKKKPAPKAKL